MNLWQQIKSIFEESSRDVQIIEGFEGKGKEENSCMKISSESSLGTIIEHTQGIVIDNWVYVLGQSSDRSAGVIDFNKRMGYEFAGMRIVAVDVVGGIYAIKTGRFRKGAGLVWYYAPDTIQWECLKYKYSEFLVWLAQGDLSEYYKSMRWSGWENDVRDVDLPNEGMLIYPYLWAKECDIETATKKVVPLKELIGQNLEFEKKFG
ncbi:MAG: DUF2625 family protein [Eubacterium sp.]|nr:DUF2625 family protein [Eubacterium sp.]